MGVKHFTISLLYSDNFLSLFIAFFSFLLKNRTFETFYKDGRIEGLKDGRTFILN